MPEAAQDYHSFLLRLWQTVEGGRLVWRASLEDVKSGEIHRFTSMDLLVNYLHERTGLIIGGNRHDIR